ncbi:SDR family oxidoreductase [Devosia neptuniae]|jgi:nucleoside-diphosphate-sugar epimerase|uniref:SDR family oxidoreductase n=1 Tax=Devosia TaxID=46913 RepID=UPI0022AF0A8A|nr:SDR family oxidoreductase [Devosia neptuniae]MCZ4347824.1 SDR family oxidoreductase [Devosia neptuniae]|tara:strand:- start:6741 stop:7610 length:870 start_codon:yes stop_codon:yes gene_type:complete
MNALFFGYGFSSAAAANALRIGAHTVSIHGTVRSVEKAERLKADGITPHLFDGTQPGATLGPALRAATHVIFSIAPGADGDPALGQHRGDLDAATGLEWLCYYSTVGVYGDFGGAWIDESAPLVPRNERSDRRVAAEQAWRDYAAERGVPLTILRLAGIYGPGRSTFDKLEQGKSRRIVKPGQVFNRIHVDDIGRITALAATAKLNGTFNLSDDEPAPPQEVIAHAADMLGVEPPPEQAFDTAEMTPMQRSFYADNKRCSNAAIKKALGIELLYPTYREGLAQILETRS